MHKLCTTSLSCKLPLCTPFPLHSLVMWSLSGLLMMMISLVRCVVFGYDRSCQWSPSLVMCTQRGCSLIMFFVSRYSSSCYWSLEDENLQDNKTIHVTHLFLLLYATSLCYGLSSARDISPYQCHSHHHPSISQKKKDRKGTREAIN